LVRQNAVSREQHDEAELGLESSAAKLEAANRRLDELKAGTRRERIDAQRAVVNQLSASLNDIAIEIDDSTLVAPFDGTIAIRQVDEGTVVAPAEPIFEIVERGGLEAQIGLPPSVFRSLAIGQSVEVGVGDRTWPAKLTRAAAVVDLRTRTRTAFFAFDSDASGAPQAMNRLVPGEVARVSFDEVTSERGFWVPTRALIRSTRGLWALYVAEATASQSGDVERKDLIVSRRDVEVLHTDAERSFIRGLLQPGDLIIVSGTQRVVPGQHVRATTSPPRA
jgi:RND family efflux transporter MFP subunit